MRIRCTAAAAGASVTLPIDFTGVRPDVCPLLINLPLTYIVGKDHYIGK